ncbi:MAG: hypothetical protein OCD01_14430 [Fibrobacterales bacterium]
MKYRVLSVACVIGITTLLAFGGERVIGGVTGSTFLDDGAAPDSIGIGWPTDLSILSDSSDYTSLIDTIIGDTSAAGGKSSEVYPLVEARGNHKFSVLYLAKTDRPSSETYITGIIQSIYLKDYSIDQVDVLTDSLKSVAGQEYKLMDNTVSPIVTLDFGINATGDKWYGLWNSTGTHARKTWENQMPFLEKDRGEYIDSLHKDYSTSQRVNIASTYTDAADTALYIGYVQNIISPASDNNLILSKNILRSGLAAVNSTVITKVYPTTGATYLNSLDMTIDGSTGNLVVAYGISAISLVDPRTELKFRVFDSDLNEVRAQRDIVGEVQATPRNGALGPKTKGFEIVDLGNGVIGMVYSKYQASNNRNVYFRTYNPTTDDLSPEVHIFSDAIYPSLSVDPTKSHIVISALKKISGSDFDDFGWKNFGGSFSTYEMYPYGAVYDLEPSKDINPGSGTVFKGQLTSDQVSFTTVDSEWRPLFFWSRVDNAIDEHKNAVFVYNDEYNAKILVYKDVAIYKESTLYQSGVLRISDSFDPGIKSFVNGEDSVNVPLIEYGCPPCDTNITMLFNMAKVPGFTASVPLTTNFLTNAVITNQFYDGDYYSYSFGLKSYFDYKKTPTLDSLRFTWNIKPQVPRVDSVKIGANGPWILGAVFNNSLRQVVNRLDTVYVAVSAYDHDNISGLNIYAKNGAVITDSLTNLTPATGSYQGVIKIAPKNIVNSAYTLKFMARDPLGWESTGGLQANMDSLVLDYYNIAPEVMVSVVVPLINGTDSIRDTIALGASFPINVGDTAWVTLMTKDSNDATLSVWWNDSDVLYADSTLSAASDTTYLFPALPGSIDRDPRIIPLVGVDTIPDTVMVTLSDVDETISFWFRLVPNHFPQLDSVISILPWDISGATVDDTIDINSDPGTLYWNDLTHPDREDPEIDIHPFISVNLEGISYDIDRGNGDSSTIDWRFLRYDTNNVCCSFDSIYTIQPSTGDTIVRDTVYRGDGLTHLFELNPPDVEITTCDIGGGCISDTLKIKYPRLDTQRAAEGDFSNAKASLRGIELILNTDVMKDTIRMSLFSKGTRDLEVFSVFNINGIDYSPWLNYEMKWQDQSKPVITRTDSNHLKNPIRLLDGDSLLFDFFWDVSNETGDRVLQDTLLIQSNDFFQPLLKIPFRVEFNDLPAISIERISPDPLDTTLIVPVTYGSEPVIPAFSQFRIHFSEPVSKVALDEYLKVYSLRDSIAYCTIVPTDSACLIGAIPERARMYSKAFYDGEGSFYTSNLAYDYRGDPVPLFTDTLLFTPYYNVCSFEGITPAPYNFIKGDDIRIFVSNNIRDSVGTRLNLEKDFLKDTTEKSIIYSAKISAAPFQVVSTVPETVTAYKYSTGTPLYSISPDSEIRINFNNRIVRQYIIGFDTAQADTLRPIDSDSLKAGTNQTVKVRTAYNNWKEVDLKFVKGTRGDSSLVLKPLRKFYSKDTVLVTLADSIIDTWGRSLDGNGSGDGSYLYKRYSFGCKDTAVLNDSYSFRFVVTPTSFYIFPNPFVFENNQHTEKVNDDGDPCIEFKNLNTISSKIDMDEDIDIRIYTVLGQLVYSTKKLNISPSFNADPDSGALPSFCWNMRNSFGREVVTGVYMYTIGTKDDGVLSKGKLAIVR